MAVESLARSKRLSIQATAASMHRRPSPRLRASGSTHTAWIPATTRSSPARRSGWSDDTDVRQRVPLLDPRDRRVLDLPVYVELPRVLNAVDIWDQMRSWSVWSACQNVAS
jgi:hypothetical protein